MHWSLLFGACTWLSLSLLFFHRSFCLWNTLNSVKHLNQIDSQLFRTIYGTCCILQYFEDSKSLECYFIKEISISRPTFKLLGIFGAVLVCALSFNTFLPVKDQTRYIFLAGMWLCRNNIFIAHFTHTSLRLLFLSAN